RRQQRESVRAESVEGDVAEVEQSGPPDGDVQAERQQRQQQRVDSHLELEVVRRQKRDDQSEQRCEPELRPPPDALREPLDVTAPTTRVLAAPGAAREPPVDADLRAR